MSIDDEVNKEGRESFLKERTEIGEAFEFLDNDKMGKDGRSPIDFNARLSRDEIRAINIVDEFKVMGVLPKEVSITRGHKRMSVSIDGKGREEKVSMAQGLREEKSQKGFLGSLFSRREK